MSSSSVSTKNRLRRALEIERAGKESEFPCDLCISINHKCIRMSSAGKARCAHCTRRGRSCVSVSWESLDRTRDDLQAKISSDEKARDQLAHQLSEMIMRIERNRKVLKQAESRAANKLECLEDEMQASGEDLDATVIDAAAVFDNPSVFESGGTPREVPVLP